MNRTEQSGEEEQKTGWMQWLKRLGLGAFLFFFIKGLIWLAVIFGAASLFTC